jgi:WD40 repeat protein
LSKESHQASTSDIAVDDTRIYSVGSDGALIIWDKATLKKEQKIPLSDSGLLSIALGSDQIYIGSSYLNAAIIVLNKTTLEETAVLKENTGSFLDLKLSDDLLVSGSADDEVILWKLSELSRHQSVIVGNHIVQSVELDDEYVYAGGIGDFVGVYRRSNLELVAKLLGHEADIFSLAVDERFVYSGSGEVWWGGPGSPRPPAFESAIRVWNKDDWECIGVLEGHTDNVNAIIVDAHLVYSASDDGTLRSYHKSDWSPAETQDLKIRALTAMTSDDEFLFIGNTSGMVGRIPK